MKKLVSFAEAILSGSPFRHYTMARLATPVWFKVHSDNEIHVIGPDDIMPMEEAVPLSWRMGDVFELQDSVTSENPHDRQD